MKKIFLKLPYFIKFIIINIYGLLLNKKRFTKKFFQNLKYYNKNDYTEKKNLKSSIIKDQLNSNNYYKEFTTIEDFPIINKNTIKENFDLIINKDEVYNYLTTSGSTGSGFKFPISRDFIEHQWAIFWKFRNIHNLQLNTWCANIISQTMFDINSNKHTYIKSYPTNQLLLSQYHLNKDTVEVFISAILRNQIKWIHAFPSVLHLFASLIVEKKLEREAKNLKLTIITTSSEKLHSYQKLLIEKTFNVKIRELYGLTEGVVNIFECENGTLHIDEEYSYVELLPIDESDEYKIIGTSYHNKAFPLIRYDTGDTCILYDDKYACNCGRKSRIVKEILGRDEDYIILDNGNKIGRLSSIFKKMIDIKESQIYQNRKGHAIFRVVKNHEYSNKSEEILISEIKEKLGNDFKFDIEYLDDIPKTKRGKLKFVISDINE